MLGCSSRIFGVRAQDDFEIKHAGITFRGKAGLPRKEGRECFQLDCDDDSEEDERSLCPLRKRERNPRAEYGPPRSTRTMSLRSRA